MEQEKWIEMWGFPNYEISDLGNVRRASNGKEIKLRQDGSEYRMAHLWYNKKRYTKRVGRLVWMSFNQCDCAETIDHINGDAGDDRLVNLQCISFDDNRAKRKNYTKKNKYNLSKKTKGAIYRGIKSGKETTWTIMKKYGIPLNYIMTTMRRDSWARYADEI